MSQATVGPDQPALIPVEAYFSEDYARAENEKLWGNVWQIACRLEEIPEVGDYVTYDILDESIIIIRNAPDQISAYYNVCQHRGRRLTEGCGRAMQFRCRFHGWAWDLHGKNTFVLDPQDWGKCLTPENLKLKEVKLDTWGGWVWINMDPNCQPLKSYLDPAFTMLGPFEFDKMRYRWRKWLRFPCNWKVAIEAFIESYHIDSTHPQLARYTNSRFWSKAENNCGWHGIGEQRTGIRGGGAGTSSVMITEGEDPRIVAAEFHNELANTIDATTTATFVKAANRLVDELPAGTPPGQVAAHLAASAQRDDAARGVLWPKIDAAQLMDAGHDWHIFPNTVILNGPTQALCYRARPDGYDPNRCIFDVYVIERFPDGEEPETEWVFTPEPTADKWRKILPQDFSNMSQVHKGMKSRGFVGARPSPVQEIPVIHFHRLLARYMGTGAPQPA
jgi:phenylpropionate dioxygenase-like ring-hydroxylating dioxygenase large terminal subunit